MTANNRLRVGVIGLGRVGSALARGLERAGHEVVAIHAISEASQSRAEKYFPAANICDSSSVVAQSDLVLLAVPDDELAALVQGIAEVHGFRTQQMVVHTSGRYGISVLAPAMLQGVHAMALHPAMTFIGSADDVERLQACPFAVTASDEALAMAQALVYELGGDPNIIAEVDRVRYHAALSHGANHLTTLISQSTAMLSDVGIENPATFITPLVFAATENVLQRGIAALTGPISRGDSETLRAHIAELPLGVERDTYVALAHATISYALQARRINDYQATQLKQVLG